jgi:hypothetical protein
MSPFSLLDKCRPIISGVPTINLTDDELAEVTAAVRRAIETDRFPRASIHCSLGQLPRSAFGKRMGSRTVADPLLCAGRMGL